MPPGRCWRPGLLAVAALALVPPFGSSDHLSYAAYGRMAVTGHDPYTTTPAALARLGDPVARAVEDWRNSPSVYGPLATAGQALAALIGGTSARLTVFVLGLLNAAAFAGTGLLLHRLARGDRAPPAAGRAAVDGQPAAAAGAGGRRARRQPGRSSWRWRRWRVFGAAVRMAGHGARAGRGGRSWSRPGRAGWSGWRSRSR